MHSLIQTELEEQIKSSRRGHRLKGPIHSSGTINVPVVPVLLSTHPPEEGSRGPHPPLEPCPSDMWDWLLKVSEGASGRTRLSDSQELRYCSSQRKNVPFCWSCSAERMWAGTISLHPLLSWRGSTPTAERMRPTWKRKQEKKKKRKREEGQKGTWI